MVAIWNNGVVSERAAQLYVYDMAHIVDTAMITNCHDLKVKHSRVRQGSRPELLIWMAKRITYIIMINKY